MRDEGAEGMPLGRDGLVGAVTVTNSNHRRDNRVRHPGGGTCGSLGSPSPLGVKSGPFDIISTVMCHAFLHSYPPPAYDRSGEKKIGILLFRFVNCTIRV